MKIVEFETKEQRIEKEKSKKIKKEIELIFEVIRKQKRKSILYFKTKKKEEEHVIENGIIENKQKIIESAKEEAKDFFVITVKEFLGMKVDEKDVIKIFGYFVYKKEMNIVTIDSLKKQFPETEREKYIYLEKEYN